MVLPWPLIPVGTVRGVVGLTTLLQQQCQSQMPSQAYASCGVGSTQVSFFSELSLPLLSLCWHAFPDAGPWLKISIAWSTCSLLPWVVGASCYSISFSSSYSIHIMGYTPLGAQQSPNPSTIFYMVGKGLLFKVWFHLIMQSNLNLYWALNLVIRVWWLDIRLAEWFIGLVSHTFNLGSQVWCQH